MEKQNDPIHEELSSGHAQRFLLKRGDKYYLSNEKKTELLQELKTAPASIQADIRPRLDKPFELERVRYYYYVPRWEKGQANVGLFYGDWRPRNLKAKGVDPMDTPIAERWTTVDEVIDYCWGWRYQSLNYNSWQKLIDDDIRCGIDAAFIAHLVKLQDKYRLSDKWQDKRSENLPPRRPK